eukprot:1299012-Pleurochrysis_carterae.AAC.1
MASPTRAVIPLHARVVWQYMLLSLNTTLASCRQTAQPRVCTTGYMLVPIAFAHCPPSQLTPPVRSPKGTSKDVPLVPKPTHRSSRILPRATNPHTRVA